MAELSGRVEVSGLGHTRVPIQVTTSDGTLVALATADKDGSWSVDVPAGEYVAHPRGLPSRSVATGMGTGYATPDTTNPETVDTAGVSAALERRRQAREV